MRARGAGREALGARREAQGARREAHRARCWVWRTALRSFQGVGLALVLCSVLPAQPGTSPGAPHPAPRAQDSTLERRTREVASQLRCPVCQGLSINDSPAELAVEMKGVVREQLAAGKSPEEVRQYFIAKYGKWVLLEPEPRGFNVLVYALPVLAVLGGALFVWRFVRRATGAR